MKIITKCTNYNNNICGVQPVARENCEKPKIFSRIFLSEKVVQTLFLPGRERGAKRAGISGKPSCTDFCH